MTVDELNIVLLVGALVLLVAVIAIRFTSGTGLPSLLVYLGIGMVLGDGGFGIRFSDYALTQTLGYSALVVILAEGGLTTRWESIRRSVGPASSLATVGTLVSVSVVATIAHLVLGLDWLYAALIGAVVASTDSAAVFSVLRKVPLPRRLSGMLEAESGFNDAPAVLLVVALSDIILGRQQETPLHLGLAAAFELAGGAVVGLVVGYLGARLLRAIALPSVGLYPIATVALAGFAFGASATMGLSGFIATYVAALTLGNSELPHLRAVQGFAEGLGWLAQIGLFVLLGLLVSPSALPTHLPAALVIGAALLFVARPLSVAASVTWFGYGWRDQAFLSWAGLRGAVPIVLACIPERTNVRGSDGLFETVFLLVCLFTLVQAPTLPKVAQLLRLQQDTPRDLDVDTAPLGAFEAHMMQADVGPGSRLHGLEIFELRLPRAAKVMLVVRDGDSLVPTRSTRLRHGDKLLIVTTTAARQATQLRLQAVSERGRLAQWYGWHDDSDDHRATWWRWLRARLRSL